jgi:RNA polymerase sigma factor (sigma-70 family)
MATEGSPQGKSSYVEGLYDQFRGPLLAFFMKRLGNRAEAEDFVQETFKRLLLATNLDQSADPGGYIFRIAANLLIDQNRQAARRRHLPISELEPGFLETLTREIVEDREPERVLIGRQSLAEAYGLLDELGERAKNIFYLHRLEGMKHKEIAALYSISVSTVEKEIIRAMVKLATRFGQETK